MPERLVNIFVYGNDTHAHELGYCTYKKDGDYESLVQYLRSRAHVDHRAAIRVPLKTSIKWEDFYSMTRLNAATSTMIAMKVISENDPYCITWIVNGAVRIDEVVDTLHTPDYLLIYETAGSFDFPRLLEDDYFAAMKLLWNAKKYISCMKLMFSTIDTIGFIEYGAVNDCFTRWLDHYCDLSSIDVSSTELWELRNSLIHMTNLDSRKVSQNRVERLIPSITHPDVTKLQCAQGTRRFHVSRFLMRLLPEAIEKWLVTYNDYPDKRLQFIHRYDTIVSESRMMAEELEVTAPRHDSNLLAISIAEDTEI